jgi:hypothetical protein
LEQRLGAYVSPDRRASENNRLTRARRWSAATVVNLPLRVEPQKRMDKAAWHSIADENSISIRSQLDKLSRWHFSEASIPIFGYSRMAGQNRLTVASALQRSILRIHAHNRERGRSVGIKPIDRGGHRVNVSPVLSALNPAHTNLPCKAGR